MANKMLVAETQDSAIKLFGKTIPLLKNDKSLIISSNSGASSAVSYEDHNLDQDRPSLTISQDNRSTRVREEQEEQKDSSGRKPIEIKEEKHASPLISEEFTDPASSSGIQENSQTSIPDKESAKTEKSILQEKALKKPDKIPPCPRCNSIDTKFCYYNNYNVNQPRHFCKSCQRYWTDGGLMRKIPVGAGRRKNKYSSSHYRHITMSEALRKSRKEASEGTILTFGSDQRIHVSHGGGENGDENSSGSSVTVSNSTENGRKAVLQDPAIRNCNGIPLQMPCYPGAPWPYPSQWGSTIIPQAIYPSSIPIPFYPTVLGCTVPNIWGIPWLIPSASSPNHGSLGTSPNSPILGKHSRDGDLLHTSNSSKEDALKEMKPERCLLIPKTLRIDNPSEAARSSIWATLGIKNEKFDSIHGDMLFKAFQSKGDEKNHKAETSKVLQANPAALYRSVNFHESS